jgi:hypothetical protein
MVTNVPCDVRTGDICQPMVTNVPYDVRTGDICQPDVTLNLSA